jgi:hypothetical protein
LKQTVDGYIATQDQKVVNVCNLDGDCAFIRGVFSIYFVFWANWLGQDIVKDIRTNFSTHFEFQNEIF